MNVERSTKTSKVILESSQSSQSRIRGRKFNESQKKRDREKKSQSQHNLTSELETTCRV